ncbi:FAD-dependent sensor of blue light [Palleronia aestuarii]|uniref:FAD-dependent sensor of blue light n=1 Tax=Palleronia aestuarii TaxID=568105 RepID=A0A2W7NH91_9RHOB|nr:BLUF domain-containing protein [Palleronia aestuarii]PZX16044.1 FAD-dependent sensor of blue light [Palleronia aestuarii]
MPRQILYTSRAMSNRFDRDIPEILRCSRRNNPELGLTGILVFTGSTFIQILEGSPEHIDPVLDIISGDTRHADIRVLLDRMVEKRACGDWTMGFGLIDRHPGGRIGFLERMAHLSRDGSPAALDELVAMMAALGSERVREYA